MRARHSETWLLFALLPILAIGAPPMLLFVFLGFVGVVLLGILMICVGLSVALNANGDFNQQIIVHGFADRSQRPFRATDLHSAVRFAWAVDAVGAGLVIVGLCGVFYFG